MSFDCKACSNGCHLSCQRASSDNQGQSYCYTGSSVSVSTINGLSSCKSFSETNAYCCANDVQPTISPTARQAMCSTTFSSCDEIQASAAYSCYSCTTSNDGSGTYQVLAGLSNSVTCSGSIVAAVTADVPLTVAPQYPTSIYGNVVAVSFASTVLLCFVAYVFRDRSKTSRKSASWLRLPLPWGQGLDFPLVGKFAIAIDAYWTKVLEDGVRQALVPYVVAETALLDLIWCFPRGKPHTSKWLTWGAFASDLLLKASIAIMFSSVNILAYDGCQVSVVNCHEGGTSVVTSSSSCFSNGIAVDSNDLQFSGTAYYLVPIVTRVLGYGIAAIRALLCDHHAKTFFVFAAVHGTAAVVAGTFVMKFQSSTSSATTDQRVKAIMSTLGMGYVGNLFEIPFAMLQWGMGMLCLGCWATVDRNGYDQHVAWLASEGNPPPMVKPAQELTAPPLPVEAVNLEFIAAPAHP